MPLLLYKAFYQIDKFSLSIFLCLCNTVCGGGIVYLARYVLKFNGHMILWHWEPMPPMFWFGK